MAVVLDLADIQGNILTAYGKLGFPKGRFITLHVDDPMAARKFVTAMLPMITTALRWPSQRSKSPTGAHPVTRPEVAVNIAFTWYGLFALGVSIRTLRGMPDEFIEGMMDRAPMLGDNFNGRDPNRAWDEVWTAPKTSRTIDPNAVHILITLNAQMKDDGSAVEALDVKTKQIEALCQTVGGVRILPGHNQPGQQFARFQELSAITTRGQDGKVVALPTEHFGFTDAIGDPIFDGQYPDRHEQRVADGNGAVDGTGKWRPLATGEFLLGYPDEAQEIPGATMPLDFSRNGTFMAYRKLHQNVVAFRAFMTETAARFGAVFGIDNPTDARNMLMAKIAGRWPDGVPLARAPTIAEWKQFNSDYPDVSPITDIKGYLAREKAISEFTYGDDSTGIRCPVTSHLRRVNTRDGLAPTGREGSALNNRRRIVRRGLPYGDGSPGATDLAEHGIIMLVVCASLFRQFEFVQQQWINYGLDASAGNDTCPLVGNHSPGVPGEKAGPKAKFVIPSDPNSGHPPFIVEGIPQFVETHGGDYFFIPSMTALRMIGMGVVDPT
jgi:deferrochelatase/peroxidase EfeB